MGKKVYNVSGTKFEVDDRYSIIKSIGYGAYGIVCAAKDKKKGKKVAIKRCGKVFQDLVDGKRILREIKLLKSFDHENVISILDIMKIENRKDFNEIYIVSELMDTDLHHVVKSKQPLTTEHIQYFIYQLLRGLKYVHSAHVIHRDLKPSNILVNGNCDLKICDFGLARGYDPSQFGNQQLTEYVVTRWYRAPELLLMCQEYTPAIDMWSVGCIMAELINRKPLFPGRDYLHQLGLINDVLGTPKKEDYAHVKYEDAVRYLDQLKPKKGKSFNEVFPKANQIEIDLLKRILKFNPSKRLSVEDALEHPYFSDLHDKSDEPVSKTTFSFEYDDKEMTEKELRNSMLEESNHFQNINKQE